MNRNISLQSLFARLAGAFTVAALSGCAATGVEPQDSINDIYRGASLDSDLGSVALRVANPALQSRDNGGI